MCPEQLQRLFDVNVFGLSSFTNSVLDDMMSHGTDDGHIFHITGCDFIFHINSYHQKIIMNADIIFFCSVAGHQILNFQSGIHAYSASKHAVRVLTEGTRRELREIRSKIRITVRNNFLPC
jgi:NAD(P)-dependent dehydrogenase (short-subunit alcohol dehydrogenase family)